VSRAVRVALVLFAAAALPVSTTSLANAAVASRAAGTSNQQLLATEQHDVRVAAAHVAVTLPTTEGAPAPVAPADPFTSPLPAHPVLGFIGGAGFSGVTPTEFADVSTLVTNAVEIGAAGTLVQSGPGWNDLNDPSFASFVASAHAAGDKVLLDVSSESLPTIARFLRSPTATAAALAEELVPILKADRIDGIDLDVEGRVPAESAHFLTYVTVLARSLKAADPGGEIICNTFPQSASDGADFFDVPALARHVDAIFVMAYDMVTNGVASANAPLASPTLGLSDVQSLLAYTKVVAPAKLILGIPFYGYDFTTSSKTPGARSVGVAESVSVGDVVAVGRPALWDVASETAFSVFQRAGSWHQTWFEDPVSVALKTALAAVLHLGGVGVWSLGQEGDETALLQALDGGTAPTR
jgi:hypothetical protein